MKLNVNLWILAFRPKTLTAAVVPVFSAGALAHYHGFETKWWVIGLCLLSALCIQVATNLINDAIDFTKGADTAERIGPQRVTQSGLISRQQVMFGAGVSLLIAFLCGIPLVIEGGLPIAIVGVVSMAMAYSYTGGPFPLAYLGLGDLFVVIFFGLIAVGGVYYLLTGQYGMDAVTLGMQIGLLCAVLIAVNNLRDVHQDQKANKKTLPVRLGIPFARVEILILLFLPFLLLSHWWYWVGWQVAAWPVLIFPLAVKIARQVMKTEPSAAYNRFLAESALLHVGFGALLSLGLYLA